MANTVISVSFEAGQVMGFRGSGAGGGKSLGAPAFHTWRATCDLTPLSHCISFEKKT